MLAIVAWLAVSARPLWAGAAHSTAMLMPPVKFARTSRTHTAH
jgi:hypothetical protein